MARTPLLRQLLDTIRISESRRPADEAVGRASEAHRNIVSRRQALRMGAVAGAAVAGASIGCAAPTDADENNGRRRDPLRAVDSDIGIVGAGMAGLVTAYELRRAGCRATLHEASTRVGGRIWSMGGSFAGPVDFGGQVIERGGELIDTPHKTMLGYANEFKLELEDILKPARPTAYFFNGQLISEETLVAEYRILVDAMRDDLRKIGAPTATSYTAADQQLDFMSLAQYLETRNAPPLIKKLLNIAYTIEYGLESDKISCLSFLFFAKASKQSKMRLWGNFSDERFHLVGGNEQIPRAIAAKLEGQINLGRRLVKVAKTPAGRVELTFIEGRKTITATHDAVVLSLPFNLLREVQMDASLSLPDWKRYAIQNSQYGTNAKLMVGFNGRPWVDQGFSGAAYSDMAYLQTCWETSPGAANASRGVLTDYTGGRLGTLLSPSSVQSDTNNFLTNLDRVFPGVKNAARRDARGNYVAHLEPWPSNPFTKGSYSANQPGYFTTICNNESTPVGNLYFAGETTNSFYEWQGFMEGAALSGVRVAGEIVRDLG